MDSKLPQLDPKLKEAYDRVLNGQNVQPLQSSPTQAAQPAPFAQPQQPQISPHPEPIGPQTISSAPQGGVAAGPAIPVQPIQQPQPIAPIQPLQPSPVLQPAPAMIQQQPNSPTPPPVQNIGGSIAYNAGGTTSTQTVVKKGKPNIMHFLLGLGAVVFLIGYTFMWIFIFNIKLPFLSA